VGPGVGHRDRPFPVLALYRLVAELVARTAAAAAFGASTLDHEPGFDSVEREAVVEALPRETDKVVDRVRRGVRVEVEDHRPLLGGDGHAVDLGRVGLRFGLLGHEGPLRVACWSELYRTRFPLA